MTEPGTILEAQVQSMLEYLRRYEVEQIKLRLDHGHRVAAEILRNARKRARQHMHNRIQRERRRMREAERGAEARLATRKRLATHAELNTLIDTAWQLLPQALESRWINADARRQWCDMLLRQTLRSLPGPAILVEHPRDWDGRERRAFLENIQREFGQKPVARADSALLAGLRIHSDNAWLDGSVSGLLAQRTRVETQLLVELAKARDAFADKTADAEARHG
jgi:hypothetical protein